jgi:hypothetical protein
MILWPIEYFLVRMKISRVFFTWSIIILRIRRMRWSLLHAFSYVPIFIPRIRRIPYQKFQPIPSTILIHHIFILCIFVISRFSMSSFRQCLFSLVTLSYKKNRIRQCRAPLWETRELSSLLVSSPCQMLKLRKMETQGVHILERVRS